MGLQGLPACRREPHAAGDRSWHALLCHTLNSLALDRVKASLWAARFWLLMLEQSPQGCAHQATANSWAAARNDTSWRHASRAPAQAPEWLSVLRQAVTYFRRALKLSRQYLSAWTLMGHEYVEMKNPPAAIGDRSRPQLLDVMMISLTIHKQRVCCLSSRGCNPGHKRVLAGEQQIGQVMLRCLANDLCTVQRRTGRPWT